MTQEEYDKIQLPAVVRINQSSHLDFIDRLDGLNKDEIVVVSKETKCNDCFIALNSKTSNRDSWNGEWHYKFVDFVRPFYDIQREQMLEIENEL